MAGKTKIEWTEYSWNPIRGCSRITDGCRNCYAEDQAARIIRMDRGRGVPEGQGSYDGLLAKGGQWNGQIKVVPELLDQPLRWTKPRFIFVNSMSDLFHENVAEETIQRIFAVMAAAPQHTFQVLTKRADRMCQVLRTKDARWVAEGQMLLTQEGVLKPDTYQVKWPLPNVWLGVSVENQAAANERVPKLLETPAAVRWLSMEPLLGPVDLEKIQEPSGDVFSALYGWHATGSFERVNGIDWVVVGGESGPRARPMHRQWVRDLRDQCASTGVPFLFKQWGEWTPGENVERQTGVVETACLINGDWQFGTVDLSGDGGHADDEPDLYRIGKHAAGRRLDGEQHDGYPY